MSQCFCKPSFDAFIAWVVFIWNIHAPSSKCVKRAINNVGRDGNSHVRHCFAMFQPMTQIVVVAEITLAKYASGPHSPSPILWHHYLAWPGLKWEGRCKHSSDLCISHISLPRITWSICLLLSRENLYRQSCIRLNYIVLIFTARYRKIDGCLYEM